MADGSFQKQPPSGQIPLGQGIPSPDNDNPFRNITAFIAVRSALSAAPFSRGKYMQV
jgi:hypothetical protein